MKQEPATGIPVIHQPYPPTAPIAPDAGEFSTGICDCFSDFSLCCLTCWCPCITFGRIAEIVDRGSSSCGVNGALYTLIMAIVGCQWVYSCTYRSKLKAQYGMQESCLGDCCAHFWCEPCALCQEYRELEHRGYNVALGWHGNMERNNIGMVPPSMPGDMTR